MQVELLYLHIHKRAQLLLRVQSNCIHHKIIADLHNRFWTHFTGCLKKFFEVQNHLRFLDFSTLSVLVSELEQFQPPLSVVPAFSFWGWPVGFRHQTVTYPVVPVGSDWLHLEVLILRLWLCLYNNNSMLCLYNNNSMLCQYNNNSMLCLYNNNSMLCL